MMGMGLYFARMHLNVLMLLASIAPTNYPKGMYINVEKPTRSVRTALGQDGKRYLILGGEGHVTGRFEGDTNVNYETLQLLVENSLK